MATVDTSSIDSLLEAIYELGGTDLLLTAGSPPLCRIDGELRPLEHNDILQPTQIEALVVRCLSPGDVELLRTTRELDFSFSWRDLVRFRGNAFHQRRSMALALRAIPTHIPTILELGLPEIVETLTELPQGLVLVTGPTGSGKSTTQAAMIDHINDRRRCHIVTIEDPIEYVHANKLSAVNQREVGDDTLSFERALRSALREDPDVLLVGEMRDPESIQAALTIAETGHLVFATLHTNDTSTAIDRIVDVFPTDRQSQIRVQLAASLAGVIAQRLVPRIGGGMVGAYEVMVATSPIRNLVREGKTAQIRNLLVTNQRDGMLTLEMSLNALVAAGVVTFDDARSRSLQPREIKPPPAPPPTPGAMAHVMPPEYAVATAPAPAHAPARRRR